MCSMFINDAKFLSVLGATLWAIHELDLKPADVKPRFLAASIQLFLNPDPPAFRKDDTPLNRKPGSLMEQSNASLQRGDQG